MGRWLVRYRRFIVVALVVLIVAGTALLVYKRPWSEGALEIVLSEPSCAVTFGVIGEVQHPGIYSLGGCAPCIEDAVDAAGGFTAYADVNCLNWAAPLNNGDMVAVAGVGDVPQRININTAGVWLLDALPGIGPALAGRIVDYRWSNGPFKTAEELMLVDGIGQAKYDAVRDLVTVQ